MKTLILLFAALLATPLHADELLRGVDRQPITREALLAELRQAEYVLLGERHDNPQHHDARAALLRELRGDVVVEHLDQGMRLDAALPLEQALKEAGYSFKAWRWPMQQTLFESLRQSGKTVLGGNLSRADGWEVAMRGTAAVVPALATHIAAAPLAASAQSRLDASLLAGHCGQLAAERLPNMRLAQRARDAAMAHALLSTTKPVALLAGNGHVRLDYGVPSLLRVLAPGARVLTVGFVETDEVRNVAADETAYDYLWVTPTLARPDPCANMRMPSRGPVAELGSPAPERGR